MTTPHKERPGADPSSRSVQPPIEDYAVIGDCRTAALISREGSIDWLCLPDFSSPSIFGGILDVEAGGRFLVQPRDEFTVKRRYLEEATPVLETTFEAPQGAVRIIDVVPVIDGVATLQPMREMLRIIEGLSGEPVLIIRFDPRPDYGRAKPRIKNHGKLGWCYSWANELLTVRSDCDLTLTGNVLQAAIRVRAGDRIRISLSYVRGDIGVLPLLGREADERLACTLKWWQGWAGRCGYHGAYKEAVIRSAVTLKLLTCSLSGAIVAAPTTSLPEAIGGNRNWDYRYCWLRDAGLTMQAFIGLGFVDEGRSFLSWLLHATRLTWPELQVVYDLYGRTNLRESELGHLAGYRGSQPVRIGNGAHAQKQLDVYGEVVFAADAYVDGGGVLEPIECCMLAGFGKVVCKKWREADHSIWEMRGKPRQYTFSKLMCWLALDRLLKLDAQCILSLGSLAKQFRTERQAIAESIEQRGFNAGIASYASELDGDRVDASLLLMPCVGYKPAEDPRIVSTYERISDRLGCDGLLQRYERGYDEMPSHEGAFGICSYWAVHHLACRKDTREAKRLFERVTSFANDVGLFGEEIDLQSGAALGNFPQAFTHVGLINAAIVYGLSFARLPHSLGPYCHGGDDLGSGRKPRIRLFAHEPAVSPRHSFRRKPQVGDDRGICGLHPRRLAVRFLYFFLFASVSIYTWWFGALAGFLHGLFLLVSALPLLPFIHPRMASEYHGANTIRQLEPPGFLALNYGYGTPFTTLLGQTLYGATLGGFLQHQAMTA